MISNSPLQARFDIVHPVSLRPVSKQFGSPNISDMLINSIFYGSLIGSVAAGILPYTAELGKRDATTTNRWPGGSPYCVNTESSRQCWSSGFDINTDTEVKWPNTGKIVHYDLSITNQTMAPDGTPRDMLVINGQFPGPVLTAGKS
jgi:hypothetical protein